jgi:methionine synthase II (cobalamin-independent)
MALRPPFRADQVGSLLRPEALKQAREQFLGPQTPTSSLGPHDDARLQELEDRCIRECITMQERLAKESLEKRIEAAAKFAPLDQLALSPQCGFASSIKGNPLTHAAQEAKLARLVETADKVWGSRS